MTLPADKTLLFLNIRSLRCNFDNLVGFIETYNENLSIICLSETWLTETDPLAMYNIPGFQPIVSRCRTNKRGGGVAFYVKTGIDFIINENIVCENGIEALCIRLKNGSLSSTNICVFYRPPNINIDHFYSFLERNLETMVNSKTMFVGILILIHWLKIVAQKG